MITQIALLDPTTDADKLASTGWFRSSRCESVNCVEASFAEPDTVRLRDSKNPHSSLAFTASAWASFVRNLSRAGL
ncbi:MAG: DUF397 domain-containing protein [Dactylosporangium sp.]|nr:DUF397 domain-containing protein [Dactylosporangium sp.]NNJ63590.1 DUF397 domain-containing protein [Dactylosporangium sp.]